MTDKELMSWVKQTCSGCRQAVNLLKRVEARLSDPPAPTITERCRWCGQPITFSDSSDLCPMKPEPPNEDPTRHGTRFYLPGGVKVVEFSNNWQEISPPTPPAPTEEAEDERMLEQILITHTVKGFGVPDYKKSFELRDYFRARLAAPNVGQGPKRVSREWIKDWAYRMDTYPPEVSVTQMIRELGHEVEGEP
jgi:hypothetical protein